MRGPAGRGLIILLITVAVVPTVTADAFGDPSSGPLPNVTDVRIYDVTGQDPGFRETGGELVDSGLNSTLSVRQQDEERRYRVEFTVNNTGSQDWTIASDDELVHDGLDPAWDVTKVWYNISQDYDGQVFDGTNVTWDTSNGGTVGTNDDMHAKYLLNITKQDDGSFDQRFEVNDTSANAGSTDEHVLDVTGLGYLDVSLLEPPNDTILKQNDNVTIDATVTCREGVCGEVDLTARYNESSSADTLIPVDAGTPFYVRDSNERTCSLFLEEGQSCSVDWMANATGALESYHLLDANASSNESLIPANDTDDSLVQINEVILMDLTFDRVSFGPQEPGTDNVPAEGNSDLAYNVTFDADSIGVDDLWVKSTPLSVTGQDYDIGPSNLTVNTVEDRTTGLNLSTTYQGLASDISPPANVSTFYWLDVPSGIVTGEYNGTITFKANTTV